jgi:hypothetical protein
MCDCDCTLDLCDAGPGDLAVADLCLDELSKDAEGELTLLESEPHECPEHDCRTLTAEHLLRISLKAFSCDSAIGNLFDGRLVSKDLTTVFARGSGVNRGMHAATFQWRSAAGIVIGSLSGMTNEGTHREPAFRACQRCDERGVMEGRLCGRLVRAAEPRLEGAQVVGAYRLTFDAAEDGGRGPVRGTLEGLVVRTCSPTQPHEH